MITLQYPPTSRSCPHKQAGTFQLGVGGFKEMNKEGQKLDEEIKKNLEGIGYGI